jgi:hypothetical protein
MGSGDFTAQCWVFSTANSGSDQYIFGQVTSSGTPANTSFQLYKKATSNVAEAYVYMGGAKVATSSATIPVGVWTHLAMVRDGGTMRLYVNGVQDGTNATLSTGTVNDSAGSFSVGRTGDYNGLYFAGYVSNVSVVKGTCLFPNGTTFTPSTTPLSTGQSGQSVLLCQANRFVDSNTATTAKTVTSGGTPSVQRFSPFSPTAAYSTSVIGGSGYFDGSGDYLTVANNNTFDTNSTFTLECWFYQPTSGSGNLFVRGGGAASWSTTDGNQFALFIESGTLYWQWNNGGPPSISTTAPAAGQWHHVAVGYNGTTTRFWLNGVSVGTSTTSYLLPTTRNIIRAGISPYGTNPFTGYISNLRFVKGTDVYGVGNSTITVPTTPLTAITNTSLLLNYTNGGIFDNAMMNNLETVGNAQISTSVVKFGSGSISYPSTGSYLYTAWKPNLEIGAGDFTIEFWMYGTSGNPLFCWSVDWHFGMTWNYGGANANRIGVWMSSNGSSWNIFNADGGGNGISTGTVSPNTWTHVALVRNGSAWTLYLNGTSAWTGTSSATVVTRSTDIFRVGGPWPAGGPVDYVGYLDDFRFTRGYARYTANFTPPTAAFPNN